MHRDHWEGSFWLQLLNFPKYQMYFLLKEQTLPLRELNFSDLCGFIINHSPKVTSIESTQLYQQHLHFLLISPIEGNWITPVWRVPGFWKVLKNLSRNGNLPQGGVILDNLWNHHLSATMSAHTSTQTSAGHPDTCGTGVSRYCRWRASESTGGWYIAKPKTKLRENKWELHVASDVYV